MDEKMPIIKKTTDYKMFKLIRGNREISKYRVAALKKSIQKNNLLHLVPIVVNGNGEIIDGQTRWSAAQQLECPVYYLSAGDITTDDMIALNAYQRAWNAMDYLNFYLKLGKPEYKKLKNFAEKHHVSVPLAICCLSMQFTYSTQLREDFKSGNYASSNPDEAEVMMEELGQLRPFMAESLYTISPKFLHAYSRVRSHTDFDVLLHQLKRWNQKIERRASRLDYLRHFEDLINKGRSTKLTRLY